MVAIHPEDRPDVETLREATMEQVALFDNRYGTTITEPEDSIAESHRVQFPRHTGFEKDSIFTSSKKAKIRGAMAREQPFGLRRRN